MTRQTPDARVLLEENAALRTRVRELEVRLARFRDNDDARVGNSLAEREALLSEAERIAHVGSWVWDPKSDGVSWSDEMYRIWGFEPGEVTPSLEAYYAGIHPDDVPMMREASQRGLQSGESEQIACRVVRPNGETRRIVMSSALLFDEQGDLRRAVGTAQDLTQREHLEDQLRHAQKMEAIGRLAGGVAHDFNNLLMVIAGNAEMLSEQVQADELRDITQAAESAACLTRQLLAFGRRAVLDRRALNINEEILSSKTLLQKAAGKAVELVVELAPALWPTRLDRGQLQQILMNLVVNARDAMPQGGRVTLRTRNSEATATAPKRSSSVTLEVADTGAGMDEETVARVFEPFFTTKVEGAGTGLGLAMVFGAVNQSGGRIHVESAPNVGSRFILSFPRDTDTPPQGESQNAESRLALMPPLGGALVVDDDEGVSRVVADYLRSKGVNTTVSLSSGEALEWLERTDFDLLVTDVQLTGLSGFKLAAQARTHRPQLPVLFITGYSRDGLVEELQQLQPCCLLLKPFRCVELVVALSELLARASTESTPARHPSTEQNKSPGSCT